MKKILIVSIIAAFFVASAGVAMAVGNGWSGYNWKANVFVGTGRQYCEQKYEGNQQAINNCLNYLEGYLNDKITMKWSEAWQMAEFGPDGLRGNGDELLWTTDAWLNNEWNGMFPGGSGTTEHVKIKWVGTPCDENNENWAVGGYCIWGQFEAIQDFYGPGIPDVWAHAIPNGYGN